jgi:hypothetical protein
LEGEILGKWTFRVQRKRWDNSINMVVRKLGSEDWRLMVLYLGD